MQTGEVEANLVHLNAHFKLPYIPNLIEQKLIGTEHGTLQDTDLAFYEKEYQRLYGLLEAAHGESTLPESPSGKAELNDLLLRVRGVI